MDAGASISTAMSLMADHNLSSLPVTRNEVVSWTGTNAPFDYDYVALPMAQFLLKVRQHRVNSPSVVAACALRALESPHHLHDESTTLYTPVVQTPGTLLPACSL